MANRWVKKMETVTDFNFMAAVTIHGDFGAQENKISHCFHFFHPSICHEVAWMNERGLFKQWHRMNTAELKYTRWMNCAHTARREGRPALEFHVLTFRNQLLHQKLIDGYSQRTDRAMGKVLLRLLTFYFLIWVHALKLNNSTARIGRPLWPGW